ncbi:hypothetical protein DVH24_034654 [Malus domestica]|uniref:ABC transporter domain-containing protein n=1 Tax=Malus domestica TaxID=3750 RepID=A0A498J068_MALDO|nr:hypothetical protein DVH24_034654 [Malus domestica]
MTLLLGRPGCGKTTLFMTLAGKLSQPLKLHKTAGRHSIVLIINVFSLGDRVGFGHEGYQQVVPHTDAVLEPAMQGRDMIRHAFGIPILDKIHKHKAKHEFVSRITVIS